jgi:hypothetical protein
LRSRWCQSGVREDESVCTGCRGVVFSKVFSETPHSPGPIGLCDQGYGKSAGYDA